MPKSTKTAWMGFFFAIALIYKIYACFQVPAVTSDVLRHLGYASHALEHNFYTTLASDFAPEPWTRYWSNQPYIYPPATLLFFYLFSVLHLGIFWVKLALTMIEMGCTYLFWRQVSPLSALLFFGATVSLWYTAHEGQFEILQTLLIMLNVLAIKQQKWRLGGFWFALSIQIKQFGVLVLPWMLYELWSQRNKADQASLAPLIKLCQGLILGFLPFLGFYLQTPLLLLLPITKGATTLTASYNPFAWNLFYPDLFGWNPPLIFLWNGLFTYAAYGVISAVGILAWRQRNFAMAVSTLPFHLFWFIIKSLSWAQLWYSIVAPGFLLCLPRKSIIHVLLLIHLGQCLHSTLAILNQPIGYVEPPDSVALMRSCLFTLNAAIQPAAG